MDTATWHEGSSGAGGCSLSMHLGEYSIGERRHEPTECKEERKVAGNACRPVLV
ncbi:hypothetical protein CK203_115805 [Vitis vinifera]|uniref:Uncharacterized protein n=1 Tax=Vitis vinifera TaxID=29760 RepID=A0A438CR21_VITVI|nr:hypothetical protein CK203_115805 [Vitis vinifera]